MVVDACGHQVNVLADAFGTKGKCRSGYGCEADIAIAHEKMIPFDPERPVRSETVFPAYASYRTPARFTSGVKNGVRSGDKTVISVACYGSAAFHVN